MGKERDYIDSHRPMSVVLIVISAEYFLVALRW